MLHPQIRRSYDDERKSALFFAVSNNDTASVQLLLEAGAMPNQDPIKCLQVWACTVVAVAETCPDSQTGSGLSLVQRSSDPLSF